MIAHRICHCRRIFGTDDGQFVAVFKRIIGNLFDCFGNQSSFKVSAIAKRFAFYAVNIGTDNNGFYCFVILICTCVNCISIFGMHIGYFEVFAAVKCTVAVVLRNVLNIT